jgi:ABC-2 type transport system ATP-binding protein
MSTSLQDAVSIDCVSKRYGRLQALDRVSLQLPASAFCVLVGTNGAGKSTLLSILMDLVRPDSGSAMIVGNDVQKSGPVARSRIGWVPEQTNAIPAWVRVSELVALQRAYYPSWDDAYAKWLCNAFDVDLERTYGRLSKGQRRRVQLLLALAHSPPILLLDEPTDGLDPLVRSLVTDVLIEHHRSRHTTLLISTHHMHDLEADVTHVAALAAGKLVHLASGRDTSQTARSYRLASDPDPIALNGTGLSWTSSRSGAKRTVVIRGDERKVKDCLQRAGLTVLSVSQASVEEATVLVLQQHCR